MKRLINRLICLCKGHIWRIRGVGDLKVGNDYEREYYLECTRCGKFNEVTASEAWKKRLKKK